MFRASWRELTVNHQSIMSLLPWRCWYSTNNIVAFSLCLQVTTRVNVRLKAIRELTGTNISRTRAALVDLKVKMRILAKWFLPFDNYSLIEGIYILNYTQYQSGTNLKTCTC